MRTTALDLSDKEAEYNLDISTIIIKSLSYFLKTSITGICNSYLYTKSDGSVKCGSTLEHGLTIAQASDQCAEIGAIIPDLPSPNDQQMMNIIRVSRLIPCLL